MYQISVEVKYTRNVTVEVEREYGRSDKEVRTVTTTELDLSRQSEFFEGLRDYVIDCLKRLEVDDDE